MSEQHDIDERHDSLIVEGDDADHVLPPPELDPFTPEPSPPARARQAMIWVFLVVVILLAIGIAYSIAH